MDEREIYREIILDHRNHPRGKASEQSYDFSFAGDMPECMDELVFCGRWESEMLMPLHFRGVGCPVSTASVSLLCQWATGKERIFLREQVSYFLHVMNDAKEELQGEHFGDVIALTSIREFSSRTKCAIFPWQTFLDYLQS